MTVQIIPQNARSSATGVWYKVYVNGYFRGMFGTMEEAQAEVAKIKSTKKVYR
jgi:hypothetical protein